MKILVILSFLMAGGVGEVVGVPLAEPPPQAATTGPAILKQLPSNPLDWLKAEAVEPPSKDKEFPGIVVTPYRDKEINGDGCKSLPELKKDLERVKEFSVVRSYGTSCYQVQKYIQTMKELKLNMKLMLGVKGDNAAEELKELWSALGDNFAMVDSISVGNEVVLGVPEGDKAARNKRVGELAAYASQVRKDLADKKHPEIPVVIVDSWVVVKDYPDLCKASDYMAVNVHPWFNPDQLAKDAGKFLVDAVLKELRRAVFDAGCRKPIRITEIGWPHAALPNPKVTDKREASQPAQNEALKSIVEAVGGSRDTIYLASVDERWKAKQDHVDPLGAEQFWGIANLGLLKKP
ncbi:glycoside hydrolase superfamily [Tuber borchii]|uniref:glucan endo-1,3-beta-D-glucosidase n=1 Tax=Tuber borchii TaxID=42251 RepID=A0A2T6ZJH9_TUBBO|nr:glycoside hydrolase superfamily [Tuber borchii]